MKKHRGQWQVAAGVSAVAAISGLMLWTSVVAQTPPAESVYRDIEVLRGVPADEVVPLMQSFNRALGVECSYCHVPDRWDDATKPQFGIARNKYRMVSTLDVDHLSGQEPITCGGSNAPARLPRAAWQGPVESLRAMPATA